MICRDHTMIEVLEACGDDRAVQDPAGLQESGGKDRIRGEIFLDTIVTQG
jgi:hypothetical protein